MKDYDNVKKPLGAKRLDRPNRPGLVLCVDKRGECDVMSKKEKKKLWESNFSQSTNDYNQSG